MNIAIKCALWLTIICLSPQLPASASYDTGGDRKVESYYDVSGALSIEDILKPQNQAAFRHSGEDMAALWNDGGALWFKIEAAALGRDTVLSFTQNGLSEFSLFQLRRNGSFTTRYLDRNRPFGSIYHLREIDDDLETVFVKVSAPLLHGSLNISSMGEWEEKTRIQRSLWLGFLTFSFGLAGYSLYSLSKAEPRGRAVVMGSVICALGAVVSINPWISFIPQLAVILLFSVLSLSAICVPFLVFQKRPKRDADGAQFDWKELEENLNFVTQNLGAQPQQHAVSEVLDVTDLYATVAKEHDERCDDSSTTATGVLVELDAWQSIGESLGEEGVERGLALVVSSISPRLATNDMIGRVGPAHILVVFQPDNDRSSHVIADFSTQLEQHHLLIKGTSIAIGVRVAWLTLEGWDGDFEKLGAELLTTFDNDDESVANLETICPQAELNS